MDDDRITAMAKVLSSTLRLAIIRDLPHWRDEGVTVAELAEKFGEEQNTVAYHLRVAEEHGAMVHERSESAYVYRRGPAAGFLVGVVEAWTAI